MFSPSIKDVMFDNLKFMYTASTALPEGIKLEDKENMFIKYNAYHNYLKQNLDDRLLAWRLIEKNYVMQPPSKIEKAIGIIAALAGVCVPVLGIIAHSGVQITHYAIEAVHLFKDSIELGEKFYHAWGHGAHDEFFKSQPIKRCVKLISKAFTYNFRHDLLHMSIEECQNLSERHFNQIVSVLETSSEKSSTGLSKEMFTKIIDAIDPNPKKEILQTIGEFVVQNFSNNDDHRLISMVFLNLFVDAINNKNVDLDYMIQSLGSKVRFVESHFWKKIHHSLIGKNSKLGIANPSIKSLINYNIKIKKYKSEEVFIEDPELEFCLEKVLLLLMRWKIKNTTDDPLNIDNVVNKQAIKTIFELSLKPETEYLFNKILKQDDKILKQNREILELKEKDRMRDEKDRMRDEKDRMRDEFLKLKFYEYEDYLAGNEKSIISNKNWEEKIENESILILNKDPDKLVKKSFSVKNRSNEKKTNIENVDNKPVIIINNNVQENDSLINESLMEIKDVIKKIDSTFNSTVINLKDKLIKEIVYGNLSNESLVEKINILFSPDQTLLTLETTFKQLYSKSLFSSDGFFYGTVIRLRLNPSLRFWISMLAFTAFLREVNQIENDNDQKQYAKDWRNSILFMGFRKKVNDIFFQDGVWAKK